MCPASFNKGVDNANEIFIVAGAVLLGETRLGRAIRTTIVQRRRGLVSDDFAATTKWQQPLEARGRGLERVFRQAEDRTSNFRPLGRNGDSFLGSETLVPVSTFEKLYLPCKRERILWK